VAVSAREGDGIERFLDAVARKLRAGAEVVELVVPYDRGDVLARLHRDAEVLVSVHTDTGTRVQVRLTAESRGRYAPYAAPAAGPANGPNGAGTTRNGDGAAN
jgi:GTP-binding protein HflX